MCGANASYCVMSGLVKLPHDMGPCMTVFFRFATGLGLLGIMAMFGKIELKFINSPLLIFRGLAGAAAVFSWFFSISSLGLGKGTVIFYSYPLFAGIFSAFCLKEKVTPLKWMALICAFTGIFMLVMGKEIVNPSFQAIGLHEFIAVLGAILGGAAVVSVKKLVGFNSSSSIYFAQCVAGFWLFIIPGNLSAASPGYPDFFLLLCIGIAATIGQLLMTEGYRHVSVATGATFAMLTPVLNTLVGVAIFKESFVAVEMAGAAIIMVSCVVIVIYDTISDPVKK